MIFFAQAKEQTDMLMTMRVARSMYSAVVAAGLFGWTGTAFAFDTNAPKPEKSM